MNATMLARDAFIEAVVWEVPKPLSGSTHDYKYRLALVIEGRCVLRYDNEAGKGDHRHVGDQETPYGFSTPGPGYSMIFIRTWRGG